MLEPLTGYLTRLGEANLITTVDTLGALCFPTTDRRQVRTIADYPWLSFESLARVTACPEHNLHATTFHHLVTKFGRSRHAQAASSFLAGCIAPMLRYCPQCIAETGQYSLLWRFTTVSGCAIHRCLLRDRCGHCGRGIPLLVGPLAIGRCPACGGDLRQCKAEPIPPGAYPQMAEHTSDLAFLLTTQPTDDHPRPARFLGQQFGWLRRQRKETAVEVAEKLGISQNAMQGIEQGDVVRKGAPFLAYIAYAAYLGVPLRALFGDLEHIAPARADASQEAGETPSPPLLDRASLRTQAQQVAAERHKARHAQTGEREANLIQQIEAAAVQLRANGAAVSQRGISDYLHIPRSTLRYYPAVAARLKQVAEG
jgi:transcriptional regulator with XRE-family HTH domain